MTTCKSPLRVIILGLRGFPNVQGGVEKHVENLAPLLVTRGCDVTVILRSPYMTRPRPREWHGVKFVHVWSPKSKSLEAIVHTFIGVVYAAIKRPDVLHIHAIGPALLVPFARALGLRVVVTHHGQDYVRQKWGAVARATLRFGEYVGMRYSNARIAISRGIRSLIREKHGKESFLISNGVSVPQFVPPGKMLRELHLTQRRFVLLVSRLVPEKRHGDLLRAFRAAELPGWKLAIVGAADHPDEYAKKILEEIRRTPNAIAIGFQSGDALGELYSNAGMFVLPSSHEGLPIALLEALSYGLPSIASGIPANLEVGLPVNCYFPVGDLQALSTCMRYVANAGQDDQDILERRKRVIEQYDWGEKASQTIDAYQQAMASVWSTRPRNSSTA